MSEIKELTFRTAPLGEWYIDLPNYQGDRADLQMVLGSDELLTELSESKEQITLFISTDAKDIRDYEGLPMFARHNWEFLIKADYIKTFSGKYYTGYNARYIWLSCVIEFIFGNYPKYIYYKIKKDIVKIEEKDGPEF